VPGLECARSVALAHYHRVIIYNAAQVWLECPQLEG